MKVFVTGASGFIGGRLAASFAAAGSQVFVDVAERATGGRVTLTPSVIEKTLAGAVPDAIFHAAGSGTVGQVAADPHSHLPNNLAATLAVLEYARTKAPQARLVFLSSAAVYGSAPPQPQRETDARAPASLYGLSKSHIEQCLAHYSQQHGQRCTSVRLFSVYGRGLRKQLLWDAMRKFDAGHGEFFGTGQELRDWVHVEDVCRFMQSLVAAPARGAYEVFNCGGQAASTAEVLRLLAQQAGAKPPVFNGQTRVGDPACLLANCDKAAQTLGWRAQVGLQPGIADFVAWYRSLASQDGLPTLPLTSPGSR